MARTPSYRLHKPSGQAVVTIQMKDHYLGKYGSVESRLKYAEILAQHATVNTSVNMSQLVTEDGTLTIEELALAFMRHAEAYYVKDGKPTSEIDCFRMARRPLVDLFGASKASGFGPLAMRAVRERMIADGNMCRKSINHAITRIRSIFRWGVSYQLVPATVLTALEAVEPLKAGRSKARETVRRRPVSEGSIERVKAILPERTCDLIDLQLLSGARPGELVMLTGEMIDRSDDIWLARLTSHKTEHHGKERILVFGPRAQLILRKYIVLDPSRRLFQIRRDTYSKAIKAACNKLKIPVWTGHWLRHNAATRLRKEWGLDVAQVMLGHSSADMTQLYAALNIDKAVEVARQVG